MPGPSGVTGWFGGGWRADGPTYDEFYAQDHGRRCSIEVRYGTGWRHEGDRNATWELRWFDATDELCAFRHPGPDYVAPGDLHGGGGAVPVTRSGSWTVELLAVVESRALVDEVLAGWEGHVEEPNGLQWVRIRLQDAALSRGGDRP